MRNIFDQYENLENRLTHALACCLAEDSKLLRRFVRWVLEREVPPANRLEIVEQQLPGESPISEQEAESRGLPDAWIHDGNVWALIIESKVASPVELGQLRTHLATAQRRGFEDVHLLVLSVKPPGDLPAGARHLPWCEVYKWCQRQAGTSAWASRMASYMEVAEAKMIADEYLREGKLTAFSGIPFDDENPYNYVEARRVLRLAMQDLRQRSDLRKELGIDPEGPGRPAITGREGSHVWDFIHVKKAGDEQMTRVPHVTLAIHTDHALAITIIPHGMKSHFRRNLLELGPDGFFRLVKQIEKNLAKSLRNAVSYKPWMEVLQRRYRTPSSLPTVDARLEFDLRTAFESQKGGPKLQSEWLRSAFSAYEHKRSNLQLAVGAFFPYRSCAIMHSPKALDAFAAAWIACKPLLRVLIQGEQG